MNLVTSKGRGNFECEYLVIGDRYIANVTIDIKQDFIFDLTFDAGSFRISHKRREIISERSQTNDAISADVGADFSSTPAAPAVQLCLLLFDLVILSLQI